MLSLHITTCDICMLLRIVLFHSIYMLLSRLLLSYFKTELVWSVDTHNYVLCCVCGSLVLRSGGVAESMGNGNDDRDVHKKEQPFDKQCLHTDVIMTTTSAAAQLSSATMQRVIRTGPCHTKGLFHAKSGFIARRLTSFESNRVVNSTFWETK